MSPAPLTIANAVTRLPAKGLATLRNAGKLQHRTELSAWENAQTGDPETDPDPLLEGYALYWRSDGDAHHAMHAGPPFLFEDDEEAVKAARALAAEAARDVAICFEEWDVNDGECSESDLHTLINPEGLAS